jgi:hypothetical protein
MQMMRKGVAMNRMLGLPLWLHGGLAGGAFVAFQVVKAALDASYAASGHPVDYATGQLAFDADRIEGYYATMQAAGTLDVYVRTQIIDFGFIACVMALGLLLGTLVARLGRPGSLGRRVALVAAGLAVLGAGFDAAENLLSFVMLARPDAIAQPVALAYSTAAAVKFGLLTLAMAALLAALPLGAWSRWRG